MNLKSLISKIFFILFVLGILGIIDASYLTYEHYTKIVPTCTVSQLPPIFSDCGQVLHSQYAVIFGVPLALLGIIHYLVLTLVMVLAQTTNKKIYWFWVLFQTSVGILFSTYLMFLQIFVIKGFCLYCTLFALISFILFFLSYFWLEYERKAIIIYFFSFKYQYFLKPLLFLINPEIVHEYMLKFGEFLGCNSVIKKIFSHSVQFKHSHLHQKIAGIEFQNPIGLAAGFDYNAQLTQILPSVGFGSETLGTITNTPYGGNPRPMLGRLPKSQSLMVNKGFKNIGANKIIQKLNNLRLSIPVGISIGRTNSPILKTQKQSIEDIVGTFKKFESSKVENTYYELNISCPNLIHGENISFYPPKNLKELLEALQKLNIGKPVFIKMPIEKTNKEFLSMLEIINKYKFIKGVIIGNLQKNRKDPSFDQNEVRQWPVGNFSGKPCEQRSNELIKLTYQKYKKRLVIIGCGGIFSTQDAYNKIKLGASLIQLITGMIYNGPTLISQINLELVEALKKDGYKNISEAIGVENS